MEEVAFELSLEAEKREKIKSNQRKEHRPTVPKLCARHPGVPQQIGTQWSILNFGEKHNDAYHLSDTVEPASWK